MADLQGLGVTLAILICAGVIVIVIVEIVAAVLLGAALSNRPN